MADKVFPHNLNVDMGSEIQFQGINWDNVADSMKNHRSAENSKTQEVIALLAQAGIQLDQGQTMAVDNLVDQVTGSSNMPNENQGSNEDLSPDFQKEGDDTYNGPTDTPYDGDDGHNPMKLSSNNKMRKIAFTHPDQISAEAIEKALANGDKRLYNTILAARKENRLRIASAIQHQAQMAGTDLGGITPTPADSSATGGMPEMPAGGEIGGEAGPSGGDDAYQQGQAAGQAASTNMTPETKDHTEFMKGFLDALDQKGSGGMGDNMASGPDMSGGNPGVDSTMNDAFPTTAFTAPNKFTKAQRASFKKIAISLGMPEEYVNAMCGPETIILSKEVVSLNNKIKEVYASNISEDTKTTVIKGLVKSAALSPDSKSEFIRFWNELLGYQDKEFWPLVAANYNSDGKKE